MKINMGGVKIIIEEQEREEREERAIELKILSDSWDRLEMKKRGKKNRNQGI